VKTQAGGSLAQKFSGRGENFLIFRLHSNAAVRAKAKVVSAEECFRRSLCRKDLPRRVKNF